MLEVRRIETGVGRFMVRGTKKDGELPRLMSACLTQALREYAEGRLRPANLGDRFKPTAFARYNLTRRQGRYMQAQRRAMGAPTPYVSPNRRNFFRTAMALAKGNLAAAAAALARDLASKKGTHLRDDIRKPGSGYQIRASGTRSVRVRITYPAARILNRIRRGANAEAYRRELPDLTRGGMRDWHAIRARVQDLYHQALVQVSRAA
jgi:hypothetical protein